MNGELEYLAIRAGAVYLTAGTVAALWIWRKPSSRMVAGALLATIWNLPFVLALHLLASRTGWWSFDARGGLLLGMPVDLYLAWALLWGAIPALAFPRLAMPIVMVLALVVDLLLMPAAAPVVRLGPDWLFGDIIAIAVCLLPAQLLARWTTTDTRLASRAVLQMAAFGGLALFVVPSIAIDETQSAWRQPWTLSAWQISLAVHVLAVPFVIGASAVQEFVTRGLGTAFPLDPPRRLVTSGLYAYIRNPMQVSGVLLLLLTGAVLQNVWVAVAALIAHIFSMGFAGWDENEDQCNRFGEPWRAYATHVRLWVPRLRPWHAPGAPAARLYVSMECGMCREVGAWFEPRGVRGLRIVPAESHPSGSLTRITYESGDGDLTAHGIEAIARAVEHLHLGWAMVAALVRLPPVLPIIQVLADASGAEPRRIGLKPVAPLAQPCAAATHAGVGGIAPAKILSEARHVQHPVEDLSAPARRRRLPAVHLAGAVGSVAMEERATHGRRQDRHERAAAPNGRRQDRSLGLLDAGGSGQTPAQPGG
jgi:protein-S-isoprenylcysteine O-methyltransferase Ste14